jgi:DNA-binding response OmpR family regulator
VNVLIVEDDSESIKILDAIVRAEGHSTFGCATVEETKLVLSMGNFVPQIVILDRMLQGFDGLDLLPNIRESLPGAGILVLSGLSAPNDKALALDRGADDYVVKPFSPVEITARLRALARRLGETRSPQFLQAGNLVLNSAERSARVAGKRVSLSNKEFQLLALLMGHPGTIFPKNEILERLWDIDSAAESNVVEATINSVRRKLEEARATAEIRNTRNIGYWIEAKEA